jgi:prephenate dehydrogenase
MDSSLIPVKPSYTVAEFCRDCAICRSRTYEEISAGRLRIFKIGSSTRIAGEDALAWRDMFRSESGPLLRREIQIGSAKFRESECNDGRVASTRDPGTRVPGPSRRARAAG